MQPKIDAHSHFYAAYQGPRNEIDPYISEAEKINIQACIASPGPCPEYFLSNGQLYRPCRWKYEDGVFRYVQQFCDPESGKVIEEIDSVNNPFHFINRRLIDESAQRAGKDRVRILVMPLHHPKLDTIQEIAALLRDPNVVALKVHGVAMACSPLDIRLEVARLLLEADKPVIVHTDTYSKPVSSNLQRTYVMNDPIDWVRWGIETGVKVLITHGARLSEEAIALARGHSNIVIGISPGILIQNSDSDRLYRQTSDFERDVLSMVPPEQIVFDVDYGWNVINRGIWDIRDWQMEDRINQLADELGLTPADLRKIYYDNSAKFFNIDRF